MNSEGVCALGFVVIDAQDLDKWQEFAEGILGMQATRVSENTLALRMDSYQWRILIERGPKDDLAVCGWEMSNDSALDRLCTRLAERGIDLTVGDTTDCAARAVKRLVRFQDPEGGRHEAFVGAVRLPQDPFVSPRGVSFKTTNLGLGHLALACASRATMLEFYQSALGLRISDFIDTEVVAGSPLALTFLRCNGRHHTLALAEASLRKRLLHLMVEVTEIDAVGHALSRCEDAGVNLGFSLGRHTNDQMLSFYPRSPSGFDIEYGCGGLVVDEASWEIRSYTSNSSWGHVFRPQPARKSQLA